MTWMPTKVKMSFCAVSVGQRDQLAFLSFWLFNFLQHQEYSGKQTPEHLAPYACFFIPPTANIRSWIVSAVVALKCEVSFVTGNPQPSLRGTWLNISFRLNLYSAAECFPKVFSQRVREERASTNERAGDFNAPGLCLREGQAHCPYTHTYSIQMSLHEQLTQTYFRQKEMLTSVSKEATQVYIYLL